MSDLFIKDPSQGEDEAKISDCKLVKKVLSPKVRDLEGFSVRRLIPIVGHKMIGPWIFFDHMGPADFKPGDGINVKPHPHINLATVTYTFEGEIWHRDSLGNSEAIRPGDVNLMVAGKGITHSERTSKEKLKSGQTLNGLQLWLALPERDEQTEPAFYHYDSNEIPVRVVDSVKVRVMIGSAYGVSSPVKSFAKTLYIEARLKKGEKLKLPFAQERGLYVASGKVKIGTEDIVSYHLAVLEDTNEIELTAIDDSLIVLIGGENIGKRYIEWNFVSSSKERIEKAKKDWKEQRFAKVYQDEEEYTPLPK